MPVGSRDLVHGVPMRLFDWRVLVRDARAVVRRSRYIKERWMWGGTSHEPIRRALLSDQWRWRVIFVFAFMIAGGAVIAVGVVIEDAKLWRPAYTVPFVAAVFGMGPGLFRLGPCRIAAERLLADCTQRMRPDDPCLACGYSLAGTQPAPDGCVECPECAAAWRIAPSRPPSGVT